MVPHNAFMQQELEISAVVSESDRQMQLKTTVLTYMETNMARLEGQIVLYHDSDPVMYDEDGQWTFDEQRAVQQTNGELQTETTLDRPLGATPLLSAQIMLPEGLCKEMFSTVKGTAWLYNSQHS